MAKAGGLFHRELFADEPLYLAKVLGLIVRNERDGIAGRFRAAGSAYAVDVVFGEGGHIEVDDVRDTLDVDAACGDVGCDHDLVLVALEAIQGPLSLALGAAGVYGDGFDTGPLEAVADLVCAVLCAAKDKNAVHLVILEHVQKQVDLVLLLDGVDVLGDQLDGVSLLADLYHPGMLLYPGGKLSYLRRHGRRKEKRLAILGH